MTPDDRADIERTVNLYFDGLYEGDADKLASVFHETSALTYEQNGELVVLTRDNWLKGVRDRASAKSQNLARADKILLIDQSGPNSAMVKVNCQIPPRYFTDYLNLLKIDGRWLVVQKIFATEMRHVG